MKVKKVILLVVGFLCVVLGSIGILIPVLPTTPFLLLAAACFANCSDTALNFLMRNRYFGCYIENYRNKTGVPKTVKVRSIIFLWVMMLISMLVVRNLLMTLGLSLIGGLVTWHIASLKTCADSAADEF